MQRNDFVLAAMCPAGTDLFTPVQIQKLLFLLDRNVSEETNGPHFSFEPYHYGPFDSEVYLELDGLEDKGLIRIFREGIHEQRRYQLTDDGNKKGSESLETLPEHIQQYISEVVEFVRSCTFTELVSSIYKAYPEMKVNSVFAAEVK